MSKLTALNDYFLVEVESPGSDINFGGKKLVDDLDLDSEGVRQGIVREISDFYTFYGMSTYAFDGSLMNEELLDKLHAKYSVLVGKRVFWPARTEMGTAIKYNDTQYVFLKWSSVMCVEEGDK